MRSQYQRSIVRRFLLSALPLALGLILLFPVPAQAHAILSWSSPAKNAVLWVAPSLIGMEFNEDLSPTLSTATVVNAANQRVDLNDAQVSPKDPRVMGISLKPNLPSDVYVVVWQTQSTVDGHVLRGSFPFKVAAIDGSIPSLNETLPGQNVLGRDTTTSGLYTGRMDGPTLFSFIMITLFELCVLFWVGAQLWHTFVLQISKVDDTGSLEHNQSIQQRFELSFSVPTLLIAFLANLGVLMGQGLVTTNGSFSQAISLLGKLMSNDRFGTFWTMREMVLLLALVVALYTFRFRKRLPIIDEIISWANLTFGLALLTAMTLSSHAGAANRNILTYAILADWLHVLAASLWVGGMMYLAVVYLPVQKRKSLIEHVRGLLTTLPRFSWLAITGVVIMALSGPFNATVHMNTPNQLITTAYGRALLVKVVCVGALLLTSAIHVGFFRPRLGKTLNAHHLALAKMTSEVKGAKNEKNIEDTAGTEEAEKTTHPPSQEVEELQEGLARQTRRLTWVLRWEPVLGIAIVICTGLMNVFAGTLQPVVAQPNQQQIQQSLPQAKPFNTTVTTTDSKFTLELNVTPNLFGPNIFTVHVLDSNGKQQDANVGVSLYLNMLDMDMGTQALNLQPDGKGKFSFQGDLYMEGYWHARLQVRTPDNALHEATAQFTTTS